MEGSEESNGSKVLEEWEESEVCEGLVVKGLVPFLDSASPPHTYQSGEAGKLLWQLSFFAGRIILSTKYLWRSAMGEHALTTKVAPDCSCILCHLFV